VSWEPRLIVTLTVVARAFRPVLDRLRADRPDERRRERNASSDATAKKPSVLPIAANTRQSVGLDPPILTPVDADFSRHREAVAWRQREPSPQHSKRDKPKRVVSEIPDYEQFRIQYLGGPTGQGPEILKEVAVHASNVFAAFRAADHGAWPRGAAGFRVLDRGGREVFWRRRVETNLDEFFLSPHLKP
jgi:hypothetical protein